MNDEVIGIYDSEFNPLVAEAAPIKATISPTSKLMEHPVENGTVIMDHSVRLPTEITFQMLLVGDNVRDLYKSLVTMYDKKELLTIQTRADVYPRMVIESMPHDESAENMAVIPVVLKLKEVIVAETQFQALPPKQVASPRNASTVKRGQQSGRQEPADKGGEQKRGSVLYRTFYGKGGN